ncbi:D-lactate dehydrogenase VanH-A [Microbacterium sp. HD4P20]|uniref:NAD(P)-dependent oxidoreductase n=1 Tax=Microbacterium sp. HD4P20 TaxID=2864874 RepID=UPI0020A39F85|nr:NAD(P)-dependent oxidoreductase [Microbacterium sp. HD4P20]MCP2635462.1 D-lactate dehydrogenase VanH-A [Microbacterium sp. HD4P20]
MLLREVAPRLDVTPVITGAAVSEATIELAVGSRCISVGHKSDITASHLTALRRAGVEYISTRSIGYDHIDVAAAESLGIRVENVAYSPASVADYTLMLMLMAVRHAASVLRRVAAHDFRLPETRGRELGDLTVGVIGTGRIGAAVIDRLRGFGCRILAHDQRQTNPGQDVPLDQLLRESDIVTLHTPLTRETHHLLDGQRIGQLKSGAVVVNTARGPLIDTDALIRALEAGRVGGAALDVVEGEEGVFYADHRGRPVESERLRRLQMLPNVIISPHSAYFTERALRDMVENSLSNCLRFEGRHHG